MIHKFKFDDLYIVVDANSGAIHCVDDVTYNVLDYYGNLDLEEISEKLGDSYSLTQIQESCGEIAEIQKAGLLFSPDIYEEHVTKRVGRDAVVKALCLHVAHDCNLRCRYCFAEEGEYHGARSLMSAEVGKASLDFLIRESGSRKNLEVDFFGGEPLMNFGVVKEIVEYGRSLEEKSGKKFRFTMTTNGMLLDENKLDYINKEMYNLVLSLDGRKEINDKMRKCINGASSYDIIVPKFQKAADSRGQTNYYLRGTFTAENLDFAEDVKHMAELGFKQISVEPVVSDENAPYSIKNEHLDGICKEYEKLTKYLIDENEKGAGLNFFHFMMDLTGGPCVWKRTSGCGAGSEYLAVTPEGELYPCHQFVGIDGFRVGDVFSGVMNKETGKEFDGCHIYSKEQCRKCWAKFYCSGGCNANAYNQNGDIFKVYEPGCVMQKKRTECAIAMAVKKSLGADD